MTPMIDMVFLLLVFFMTVSTLAQAERAKEVDLPESAESDVPGASELSDRGYHLGRCRWGALSRHSSGQPRADAGGDEDRPQ